METGVAHPALDKDGFAIPTFAYAVTAAAAVAQSATGPPVRPFGAAQELPALRKTPEGGAELVRIINSGPTCIDARSGNGLGGESVEAVSRPRPR